MLFTKEGGVFTKQGGVFTREGGVFTREGGVFTRESGDRRRHDVFILAGFDPKTNSYALQVPDVRYARAALALQPPRLFFAALFQFCPV